MTHRIVQPRELCATKRSVATKQSSNSKTHQFKLWNTKEQFKKRFNLAAISAPGHVTVAEENLQLQNWTPRALTNSSMTSDLSLFDDTVHRF